MSFIRNLGGAALMFPFLCFLCVADITDWKYVSKSHTGCEQHEPLFFFLLFSQVEPGCLRQIRLFCTQSFTDSSAFLTVCQVFNEKLSGILCNFVLFEFVWAQIYPFWMCYFYKPGKEGPIMADLMCSIRCSASDTTADAVKLLKQSESK